MRAETAVPVTLRRLAAVAGFLVLSLLAGVGSAAAQLAPLTGAGRVDSPWQPAGLPDQAMARTRFGVVTLEGDRVLQVEADDSYGNLVHALPAASASARQLQWRWRVDRPNLQADLRRKGGDDAALKVCVLFDLPDAAVPFFERQLLRLARERTGERLPAATVCYVWDARLAGGTVVENPFSRRVRTIVLQGAGAPTQAWRIERRDLAADFLMLFGDESREVPPLSAVAVGADADNTHGRSLAHIADLALQ